MRLRTWTQKAGRFALGMGFLALAFVGCSGQDPECEREDRGALEFILPEGESLDFTGTLKSIDELISDPPVVRYAFTVEGGSDITFNTNAIGYLLPLEVGTEYTVSLSQGEVLSNLLNSYAMVFTDESGVAVLAVADWRPQYSLFTEGYPVDGLTVAIVEPDCVPRVENTREYRDITNRQLSFALDGATTLLYHGDQGRLGDWTVDVLRAHKVVAKANIFVQDQYSFVISRTSP